jgi:acetoin utilization deacetylase AcuC-like enzyme
VRVFHCDQYSVSLPEGHRFPMAKYRLLRELLLAEELLRPEELLPAPLASREQLALVHDRPWLDAVFTGALTPAQLRQLGFPWSEELLLRSRASVGGTLAAARAALQAGTVAGNLAGGTHHAFAGHGEGYCVFNDLAVTVRVLQTERCISRAAVIDLDVHQGNGTAALFETDLSVYTFSMHGARNFPFRKQRSSRDVELADGCGDDDYLALLSRHLPEVLEAAQPDLVLYQAGVDPLQGDALGRLALSHQGLRRRDRLVIDECLARRVPLVLTLGGGYARPVERTVLAHAGTYREALAALGAGVSGSSPEPRERTPGSEVSRPAGSGGPTG